MAHHSQGNAHASFPTGGTSSSAFASYHHSQEYNHNNNNHSSHGHSQSYDLHTHPYRPTASIPRMDSVIQDHDEDDDDGEGQGQDTSNNDNDDNNNNNNNNRPSEALINPEPSPLPEPYIINQSTAHNTPQFSFGSLLDVMTPKILHETIMSPVPQGKKFMCVIVRKNEGMDKRLYPTYELSLEEPERQRSVFLLRATKKKRSRGSYYAITSESAENTAQQIMDKVGSKSSPLSGSGNESASASASVNDIQDRKATDHNFGVLGKLRSNFLGTAFNVYSNGRNPFSSGGGAGDDEDVHHGDEKDGKNIPVRQELGAVIYNPNVLGLKGPRKMTILMNTMTTEGDMAERRPTHVKDTLIGRMTDGDMSDLLVLRNKSPQWNDVDYIIMQFGRTSQDTFTMDCQYPMTPFQAFAFALTSFDAKLACE
ncbi:Tubby- protein 1 [Gryganskiella cystojenkinii]|nr:Tubby- protein 1 [Gryganskiella cystojenkinii]